MLEMVIKSDFGTNILREYAILITWSSTILAKYNLETRKFWQIRSFSHNHHIYKNTAHIKGISILISGFPLEKSQLLVPSGNYLYV